MSSDVDQRIARNEATFRRINEDIGRGRDAGDDSTLIGFVCECGSADCARLIELTPAEYEQIRSSPTDFVVVTGHEMEGVEVVIDRTDRYTVVRKKDSSSTIALASDPRA